MYSLLVPDNPKECTIRAKGIKKSYVKKKVRHDQFLNVLKTLKPTPSTFRSFQSVNHVLRTVEINKTCQNAFDDKRYILNDGVGTLAYGHYRISGAPWTLLCIGLCRYTVYTDWVLILYWIETLYCIYGLSHYTVLTVWIGSLYCMEMYWIESLYCMVCLLYWIETLLCIYGLSHYTIWIKWIICVKTHDTAYES